MSAAYDLASYIASTLGKGTLATNIFVNTMLDSPNSQIAVHQYGGRQSDLGMGSLDPDALENPNLQIAVRDANASAGWSTIYSIYKSLDGFTGATINGTAYLFCRALQPPFLLERDEKGRVIYVFNVDIQKRRSA